MLKNDRVIRALLRQPVDRTPVWIMRQAGRYLPEYRALRETVPDFMTFCKTPELACQATLQPLERFDLDAAIVFSDILTIPDAVGMPVSFKSGEGPVFHNPIRSRKDVDRLKPIDVEEELSYVMKTIALVTEALGDRLPLIGFSGSPWTVATYMVEGGSSKTFSIIKKMLYRDPDLLHHLLKRLTLVTIDYLNAQIRAGARAIMVFDTWGGILSTKDYAHFSLAYMSQIAEGITRQINGQTIPLIFFTKQSGLWLEQIASSGCDAVGLDWTIDISNARDRIGGQVALQGNLDPCLLFAEPNCIQAAVREIIEQFGPGVGHIFNLGHGILPDTPVGHVEVMLEAVHQYSGQLTMSERNLTHHE